MAKTSEKRKQEAEKRTKIRPLQNLVLEPFRDRYFGDCTFIPPGGLGRFWQHAYFRGT